MDFLTINNGRFEFQRNRKTVIKTADPDKLFRYLLDNGIDSYMESSSVHHPEEYGMDMSVVDRLDKLVHERQAKQQARRDKMLTPIIFRVQRLSSERPAFPKNQRREMTRYRKTEPCEGAVWKRKDQWWQLQLDSLTDLVEFQKAQQHSVSLDHGVLTINDLPLHQSRAGDPEQMYPLISDCAKCRDCRRPVHDYYVPDELWAIVVGEEIVLCWDCFADRANRKDIWHLDAPHPPDGYRSGGKEECERCKALNT